MSDELREILGSAVIAESVRIATGPELDLDSLLRTETMVSDFLKLSEHALQNRENRQRLAENLMPLFRRKEMPPIDDAKLCEWIERATAFGLDLLMDGAG